MQMLINRSYNSKPTWKDHEVNDFLQLYYTETGRQNIIRFFGRLLYKGGIYYASPMLPGLNFSGSELVISDTLTYDDSGLSYKKIVLGNQELTAIGISIANSLSEGTNYISLLEDGMTIPNMTQIVSFGYDGKMVYFIFKPPVELVSGTKYYIAGAGLFSDKLWSIFSFMTSEEVPILTFTERREVGKLIAEPDAPAFVLAMEFTETIPASTSCICYLAT